MRIGYLECFAGISGDMLLGALVDAGVLRELLESTAQTLNIGAELRFSSVDRSGISATKVDVIDAASGEIADKHEHSHDGDHHAHSHSHSHQHHHDQEHSHTHQHVHGRSWKQIRELIEQAQLPQDARSLALRAFELLAHAEAKIHNVPVETVHFHEVGAVDTITDIVCGAAGLCSLRVDAWHCSAVNVGSGFVECAHGMFPVPAPATAELLKGIPTYAAGPKKELTTPTGAALLKALGCNFDDAPALATEAIGYGAGTRNPDRFPNVLRLSIGHAAVKQNPASERVVVLECAVDDATPQLVAHCMDRVLEEGALDVMCTPVVMKKNRMGSLLTVLCRPELRDALEDLLLRETTTLGIRVHHEDRVILQRRFVEVHTEYGSIRVKVGSRNHEDVNSMPEYEDCLRAAREHNVPLKQVMQAALVAAANLTIDTKAEA
jgi:pyridinium-3,5-bisthiocarboxylic acid mononucleotide nickel chelatase